MIKKISSMACINLCKVTLPFLLLLFISINSFAQQPLSYYLPTDVDYDPEIPTPEEVLGYQVGEWHVSHDQLVYYMQTLAAASDRINIQEYARTYENRPLLLLAITSPANQAQIETLKENHRKLSDPAVSGDLEIDNMPAVVWMGYSVHGNEPSGSNASLLVAYYLAAAQGEGISQLLDETMILLDPALNPDGLNRFASWVNSHKSKNISTDPQDREHNEAWPRGRTNHYWFDLNRDWLPLQLPESKGRVAKFHEWKPNILTDHHEMGTNSTFFFQPGVPSRNHPLTPGRTFELTEQIAAFHAKALDGIGSLYFTKENYDDFFYGKGSTYPDVNGGVGILFEQASSRGHAQESVNGVLEFPFTIRNQFATSLSTLEAVQALKNELLAHQRNFYQTAMEEAAQYPIKAYVFGSNTDKASAFHLAEIIDRHQIEIFKPTQNISINNTEIDAENAYVVPMEQAQYRLIKAMFEKRTSFQDSLFYDISAWTFPLAFNLEHEALNARNYTSLATDQMDSLTFPKGEVVGGQSNYAYAFEWDEYYAPRALNRLLDKEIIVKVATKPFNNGEGKMFDYGSIMVSVNNQEASAEEIFDVIRQIALKDAIDVYALNTGLGVEGISLGSPSFETVQKPEVALLVDGGVSSYDAGEIWHLLDQRFNMNLSLLPIEGFNGADINRYNTILMVDGSYGGINNNGKEKLKNWISDGGTVVAMQGAAKWLSDNGIGNLSFIKDSQDSTKNEAAIYADMQNKRGAQVIGGAIFQAALDLTHPVGYGYNTSNIPLFRNNTLFLKPAKNPYADPLAYTEDPLLSGYISEENAEKLENSVAITVSAIGRGRIISMTDNPAFRAFWYGTNKLLINSIFFAPVISRSAAR